MLKRRAVLGAAAATPLWAACSRTTRDPLYDGGWVGANAALGHRLRDTKSGSLPAPSVQRRAQVLIIGAGIAGLSCARALRQRGIVDVQLLELEDSAGGNSRGHQIAGMACPLGAHYLPVPDERNEPLVAWLEELGLSRVVHGERVYDERHLCHSPQERLFIQGQWQDGLLPMLDQGEATLAQYRRFSQAVLQAMRDLGFRMPTVLAPWTAAHAALDAITFDAWLRSQGFDAPALRTYLDYCCRDDYGAGLLQVSAWAGLHYFASRHGFHAPGDPPEEREGVLTWPQGNAWLAQRLAEPLREHLQPRRVALRVDEGRDGVDVDVWDAAAQQVERWRADRVVLAVPLFIAARLLVSAPSALAEVVAARRYAPWLVANLQLDEPLDDRGGAAPAWDNVIHGSRALGYVDAMHQSTRPFAGATVITAYWALGGDSPDALRTQRAALLQPDWRPWAQQVIADLSVAHPDLLAKVKRADLMRYGHAMSVPTPGVRGSRALQALWHPQGRIAFSHADLSGYSVFEEAFFHGQRVADAVVRQIKRVA